MGGFFAVASRGPCTSDLFFGTDYHSHLGTRRGGMASLGPDGFTRFIHDISGAQFRSKFADDVHRISGNAGIGVISDCDDQPLIVGSHLGTYAIVTVGAVQNADALVRTAFSRYRTHFSEMSDGVINPTELTAALISREDSFEAGIRSVQEQVIGSCSLLLLTGGGIYAARDRYGRTPVVIGRKADGFAVTMETSALPNLGYEIERYLGPGETVLVTPEGIEQRLPPGDTLQICAFLWVYYGYPASSYEEVNVERARYRSGAALARRDDGQVDMVSGIPDSGVAHAIGYSSASGIPYGRPFVKYTPTWPRSFMPPRQEMRDLVARMKLIPVPELTRGARLLFCDDSIVRGTQLRDTFQRLYDYGAREIHLRVACPPLLYACPFLNFSRSKSEMDLAARRAIRELDGGFGSAPEPFADPDTDHYRAMVERIGRKLRLTTLRYQRMEDMVASIGLPRTSLCTGCWTGPDYSPGGQP